MDTATYAILMKKINAIPSDGITTEEIQTVVNDYLTKNPIKVTETALVSEIKNYLEI